MRSLGADDVIDYTKVDYTATDERYDWILDTDSHQPILRYRRALRANGVYITLGGGGPRLLQATLVGPVIQAADRKRMGLMLWWRPFKAEDVATLTELIAAGNVTPVIHRRFELSQVVEALRFVEDGRARGKVVVTV